MSRNLPERAKRSRMAKDISPPSPLAAHQARKASKPPRWWTAVGVIGAVIGLALWVAVVVVAWHFIEKYW